jgi:hypothetical protein
MLGLEAHPATVVLLAALCFFCWLASKWIYNLYFHPLAHIPGPKLAAATYLYQTYYSLVGGSHYYIIIKQLHEKYGKQSVPSIMCHTCLNHPFVS